MSEAVRQLTPVEVARDRLISFMEDKELILDEEMGAKFNDIFNMALKYESDYQNDRFRVADMNVQAYKEENMHLKTQLRILSKYIEGHGI